MFINWKTYYYKRCRFSLNTSLDSLLNSQKKICFGGTQQFLKFVESPRQFCKEQSKTAFSIRFHDLL